MSHVHHAQFVHPFAGTKIELLSSPSLEHFPFPTLANKFGIAVSFVDDDVAFDVLRRFVSSIVPCSDKVFGNMLIHVMCLDAIWLSKVKTLFLDTNNASMAATQRSLFVEMSPVDLNQVSAPDGSQIHAIQQTTQYGLLVGMRQFLKKDAAFFRHSSERSPFTSMIQDATPTFYEAKQYLDKYALQPSPFFYNAVFSRIIPLPYLIQALLHESGPITTEATYIGGISNAFPRSVLILDWRARSAAVAAGDLLLDCTILIPLASESLRKEAVTHIQAECKECASRLVCIDVSCLFPC